MGAPVLQCDFSVDSKWLRTADAQRNLRYFGTDSGRQQRDPSALRNCLWSTSTCVFGGELLGLWAIGDGDKSRDPEQRINGTDKGILKKKTLAGNEKEYVLRVACSDDGTLCLVDEPCKKWSAPRSIVVGLRTVSWPFCRRREITNTTCVRKGTRPPGTHHVRALYRGRIASIDNGWYRPLRHAMARRAFQGGGCRHGSGGKHSREAGAGRSRSCSRRSVVKKRW